jgi:hypothetical protein
MNKQELIAHFQEQKKVAEVEIAFWQAQPDDVPDKPKLGHGDFGNLDSYGAYAAVKCAHDISAKRGVILLVSRDGLTTTPANEEIYINQWHKFGNIFDLMKDWSEDLTEFEKTCANGGTLRIEICGGKVQFCIRAVNDYRYATASISQAEEIWRKLGQMIAYCKRTKGETK